MKNNEIKKLNEPISVSILSQEFDEVKVPLINKRLYKAEDVDHFLTQKSSEVEQLEKASKRLFQFYEKNKNGRVAESNSGPIEETETLDDVEMMQVRKAKDQQIDRMQKHMQELLEAAANKADGIVADAELEREQILQKSKMDADDIISQAQLNAAEISRTAEEKIKEMKLIKYEMNQKAQEIHSEIVSKADQLDAVQKYLAQTSQKLRGLVEETSA